MRPRPPSPPPPALGHSLAVSCQVPKAQKHASFFTSAGFGISTKAAALEQPLRLFAGLNFTDVRPLLFSPDERGAAGMYLQDKCSCVCARESSGTKRPFQSADGLEKVSIMCTSNQSKTKGFMKKTRRLWRRGRSSFFFFPPNHPEGSDAQHCDCCNTSDGTLYTDVCFMPV